MFSYRHQYKHNFHDDDTLDDQTPQTQSLLSGLPSEAAAIGQFFAHGMGDVGERAAVAQLPMNNPISKKFMATGIKKLYGFMPHPPLSYLGNEFQYRSPDGSHNNILNAELGKAGLPYAKSVPGKTSIHGARPDPGDLFDHIFRSNADDKNISDTSSYLDLSPLYGIDKGNQDAIRLKQLGLLKPDTFAEQRLLFQPPGVNIYLIMYNRFHNYVAKQLLEINENGKFSLPFPEGSEKWKTLPRDQQRSMKRKQDEDLFQTARLITCGLYINISIHDYLRVLMGFHAYDTPWTLDPRIHIPGEDDDRAVGNMVSVEFNLLYRFHSAISTRDRIWSENFFANFLKVMKDKDGKAPTKEQIINGEIDVPLFKDLLDRMHGKGATPEDKKLDLEDKNAAPFFPEGLEPSGVDEKGNNIFKFKRGPDGKFNDAQLVAHMVETIEDPICQFGAQNIPKMFKAIEILGILQARKWEVATLNEFREFLGLEKHETFEDINKDKDISSALRNLYGDPDMVELYPGLMCEGQGRCLDPGVTGPNKVPTALWAGVFSDAVTLIRSDRFYTVDWNVASLTSWGMREVSSDQKVMKGSVLHRLFQRAFPGYFKSDSVYLWQPFITPNKNIELAKAQRILPLLDVVPMKINKQPAVWEAVKQSTVINISNYEEIRYRILGSDAALFQKLGYLDANLIPGKYLQAMLTGRGDNFDKAAGILQGVAATFPDFETIFMDYFAGISAEIRLREQRSFQKIQLTPQFFVEERKRLQKLKLSPSVLITENYKLDRLERSSPDQQAKSDLAQNYQIDVIRDYAIPIITRFVADFLGFWDILKTPAHTQRKYNENQIYEHIHNCQNYLAYNSDETTQWKRRLAFKNSIAFLKKQAEYGVYENSGGLLFNRNLYTTGDQDCVVKMREFGVKSSKALARKLPGKQEEVAAILLAVALDASQKAVMTFTEVLAHFIDNHHEQHPDMSDWIDIQNLAYSTDDPKDILEKFQRYVLEAQRIRVDLPLVRKYVGTSPIEVKTENPLNATSGITPTTFVKPGDKILLQLKTAQTHPQIFPNPETISLTRPLPFYLIYSKTSANTLNNKSLTLLALTGMLKHLALLKDLRVAHDKPGRLKRVRTPIGSEGYMSVTWDEVVSFPATWSLRFNGEGRGVFMGPDNADQGHGMDRVYQKPPVTAEDWENSNGTELNGNRTNSSGR